MQVYTGPAYRHGCTTDVKLCWQRTAEALAQFQADGDALHKELVTRNLVSKNVATGGAQAPKKRGEKVKARRKQSRPRANANASTFGVNAHIKGTALEKVILETRAKEELAERQNR
jgi:hypothetical protein